MLKRIITDSICKEKYLELFENLSPLEKDYSIAHNPDIPSILEKTFGYKPKFISFYDKEELVGVIPACSVNGKFVSMPHFSYGGFVGRKQVDQSLIQTALSDFNKFEIRGMNKVSEFYSEDKVTAYLFLQDNEEEQLASFKYNIRRQIRVASEKGVVIKNGQLDLLDDFYTVYSKNMSRLGSPTQPKKFFKNILEGWENGDARIFCAYLDNKPIGSSFILSFKGIVENCWAATLWEYNKIYTPYLLYSELLRYSIRNGNKIFSFGRSSFDSGTLSFKKHWKPEIIPLIFNFSETHKKGLKGNKSLTNLYGKYVPEVLNNLVGKVVTKYIY